MDIKNQFAKKLMEIEAIKLQPNDPFTWASGSFVPTSALFRKVGTLSCYSGELP